MASARKLRSGEDYKTDVFDTKAYLQYIFTEEALKTHEFTTDLVSDLHSVFQTGKPN